MTRRDIALKYFEGHKEYTDARVKAGIEQHRKGNVTLSIKDSGGNALKGAKVFVNHKKHEFRFGANIFMLDELPTEY